MSLAPPQPVLEEGGGDGREQHGQQQGAGQGQAELHWHEWTFEADIPRLGRGESPHWRIANMNSALAMK
jgi:hypothetical protein